MVDDVLLHSGAAKVMTEQMFDLYRMSLFWADSIESRANRGKSFTIEPVVL